MTGCQPFTRPCTTGDVCIPKAESAGWWCQPDIGSGGQTDGCAGSADCAEGLICDTSASLCVDLCERQDDDCAGGQSCVDLNLDYGSDYDGVVGQCDPPAGQIFELTVTLNGPGLVDEKTYGALDCQGSACTGRYVTNASFDVEAVAQPNSTFVAWTAGPCMGSTNPVCGVTMSGDLGMSAQFTQTSNLAFVTSETFPITTAGGIAAMDAHCQAAADAAGFGGTFLAWLHTSTQSPKDRFNSYSGWVRTDGRPWMQHTTEFVDSWRQYYPLLDENGEWLASFDVAWVGNTDTCADWSSTLVGNAQVGNPDQSGWWNAGNQSRACNSSQHLVCLETTINAANVVPTAPPSERRVFSTAGSVANGSLASLDAFCQTQADLNGHPSGTYRALVATTSQSATGRFLEAGPNWYREDHVAIAESPAEFKAGNWIAAPAIDSEGNSDSNSIVWAGSDDVTTAAGSTADNCNNFTSVLSGDTGYRGVVGSSQRPFTGLTFACSNSLSLICVQE